uniref:G_PROTEIN_RECEP_F1_2 domain-containing protein n=1 Tax=Bursaphelenchus xylophilus TaxID=6326 RepID=A0A1I7RV78_BURXY
MSAEDVGRWLPKDAQLADLFLDQLLNAAAEQPVQPSQSLLGYGEQPRLFFGEPQPLPDPPQRKSKVLNLVMQVLSSMITTTAPAPLAPIQLHTSMSPTQNHTSLLPQSGQSADIGMVPIIIIGTIFAIATTLGNLMVMISIRVDKQLQTISNYFLFSLAIADITIGIISIPLMTYYTSTGYWGIGWNMCQFWLCLDYLMSNASVLNLLLISFDRYFSITRPLTYRPRRTTRKALFAIFLAYAISMALWPPWILTWPLIENAIEGSRTFVEPMTCVVQFLSPGAKGRWASQMATVATSFFAFYLPVTIMIYLYYRVYCETRKRTAEFRKLQAGQLRQVRQFEEATNESLRDSVKQQNSIKKSKQGLPFMDSVTFGKPRRKSNDKFFWLRYCVGKAGTEIDSEESSETNVPTNGPDWISGKTIEEIASTDGTPISPTNNRSGSAKFRSRTATEPRQNGHHHVALANSVSQSNTVPILHTYTVLIEYKDGESKRPSVRLSSCDSDGFNTETPINSTRSSRKAPSTNLDDCRRTSHDNNNHNASFSNAGSTKLHHKHEQQNGKTLSSKEREDLRKSEKERRKNERRQESKAAKTLSAILFAFIVTWTPYNVIVCWEAFYPNSVPEILFTISYCLCYVNSTINPICYACNGRFLKTYVRILRCQFWKNNRRNDSLYRNAYLRR